MKYDSLIFFSIICVLFVSGCTSQNPIDTTHDNDCEQYHYSTCPDYCEKRCVGSCPQCADCDGPGSCISLEYYISCGCGCCSFDEPLEEIANEQCLYKSEGDKIKDIIEVDKSLTEDDCATAGCSYPIKYVYCD